MKLVILSLIALSLAACAAPRDPSPEEVAAAEAVEAQKIAETRAYLDSAAVPTVAWIRVEGPISVVSSNRRFAQIAVDDRLYLLETDADCPRLTNEVFGDNLMNFTSNDRVGRLVAGVDAVRGCRIEAIYDLAAASGGN